ncbi:hypothetical protein [Novosphingobium sp. 9]|nr:hypothetical protein [Novosphingobium sp. 9]
MDRSDTTAELVELGDAVALTRGDALLGPQDTLNDMSRTSGGISQDD